MKTRATAKFIGTSSRKINLVASLIRGRNVIDAQALLNATNKRATSPVGSVLASAVANAESNLNIRKADLRIESIFVGPGPTLKRFRPRAKGSASSIKKRSSNITVVVSDGPLNVARSSSSVKPEHDTSNAKRATKTTKAAKPKSETEAK